MILSKKISKKITDTLVTNEIIEPQKEGIYFYCLDFSLDLILFNCSLLTVMIWGLAPVGNAHKHYTTAERTKIKKILFFLLFFIYAFAVLMLSWKQQLYYHMILICMCQMAAVLIGGGEKALECGLNDGRAWIVHSSYQSMYRTLLES